MCSGSFHEAKIAKISEQKMQFDVVSRRPTYTSKDKDTVKAEIEKQLFAIFCKYGHHR